MPIQEVVLTDGIRSPCPKGQTFAGRKTVVLRREFPSAATAPAPAPARFPATAPIAWRKAGSLLVSEEGRDKLTSSFRGRAILRLQPVPSQCLPSLVPVPVPYKHPETPLTGSGSTCLGQYPESTLTRELAD